MIAAFFALEDQIHAGSHSGMIGILGLADKDLLVLRHLDGDMEKVSRANGGPYFARNSLESIWPNRAAVNAMHTRTGIRGVHPIVMSSAYSGDGKPHGTLHLRAL